MCIRDRPIPQRPIHCRRKQREPETRQTAQDDCRRDTRGRVARVRVDNVGLHALEADYCAGAEEAGADVGHNPVEVGLGGPAVPEEADWD